MVYPKEESTKLPHISSAFAILEAVDIYIICRDIDFAIIFDYHVVDEFEILKGQKVS